MNNREEQSTRARSERLAGVLPRKDFLLIPLISLATLVVMFAMSEVAARIIWSSKQEDPCRINDPLLRYRYRPNCNAHLKLFEGKWVDHTYNDCGFRSKASCKNRTPGSIRIAIIGSSFAQGYMVPYDETFAGIVEKDATQACHRPVEIQNLSAVAITTMDIYHRVDAALALHPDVVIISLAPHDLEYVNSPEDMAERDHPKPLDISRGVENKITLLRRVRMIMNDIRTTQVMQHFVSRNSRTYADIFLRYGDHAGFLHTPIPAGWQERYAQWSTLLGSMADKIHARGIPVVWIPGMQRAEAQLLSTPNNPPGVDPYLFQQETDKIALDHGVIPIPVDNAFSKSADAGNLFYPVDGHPTPAGQELLGHTIERELLQANIPAFAECRTLSAYNTSSGTIDTKDQGEKR